MDSKTKYRIEYSDLGLIDYKEAWDLQEKILKSVVEDKLHREKQRPESGHDMRYTAHQTVLFCEHPHVYTLGKSGQNENMLINEGSLKKLGASFYKINRGGDITYHGPGQIVGYPIIDLESFGISIKDYIYSLEECIILTLRDFGITAERMADSTGVWLDTMTAGVTRKICAIGVRVSRYVTMHGFALNVNTDLKYFQYINPCGFIDKGVTSMAKEKEEDLDMEVVKAHLLGNMSEIFQLEFYSK